MRLIRTCAAAAMITMAISAMTGSYAVAQTQMQGQEVTTPGPGFGKSPKVRRAECTSEGKKKGLKGRELTKFVNECVKSPF